MNFFVTAQVVLKYKKDVVSTVTGVGSVGGGGDNFNNYNTILGVPLGVYGSGRFGGHGIVFGHAANCDTIQVSGYSNYF